jgi:hypothetical protein
VSGSKKRHFPARNSADVKLARLAEAGMQGLMTAPDAYKTSSDGMPGP